ncbi:MAG TPA: hypothetical protein VFF64_09820 [Candidatus Eremiobacteraceae bacterium]|nr:hypothetical protein [Candidatus Eremiobacteraceae bacterium]
MAKKNKRKIVLLVEQGTDGVFDLTLDADLGPEPLLRVDGTVLPSDASLGAVAEAVLGHVLCLSGMKAILKMTGSAATMDEFRASQKLFAERKTKAAKAGK